MRKYRAIVFAALIGAALAHPAAWAQDGDDDDDAAAGSAATEKVTRASKNVPELILGSKEDQFTVNQKDFELIAGQGYRWKISAAGGLEYKFHTDLFRDVWMNQIVIEDLEVHMNGAPAWLEFDADGTIQVQFTTVRPGSYTWSVPDLAEKGMKGTITVK
jgi:plastocyanin